jgi:Ca-activated chloride channel family protein
MRKQMTGKTVDRKHLNFLLLAFTFLAGCLWWFIGERLIAAMKGSGDSMLRNPLLNASYFAFLALFTLLACFFSEKIVHSIVSADFFGWAVNTPSLKIILLVSFAAMFFASGISEFLYELEISNSLPKIKTPPKAVSAPVIKKEIADYYFLLDNSESMEWNDPNNERIKLLKKVIDDIPEEHQIALLAFNEVADLAISPAKADKDLKTKFKAALDSLHPEYGTDIKTAFTKLSSIIDTPVSHRGHVIFISDGEDGLGFNEHSRDFRQVIEPFIQKQAPINTVFLNAANISSSFLQEVSRITGGSYSTVNDPLKLESEVLETINAAEADASAKKGIVNQTTQPEKLRDILALREGKRQGSAFYAVFHIVIVTAIGLLLGYLLYMMFSHRDVMAPLIFGGGAGGLTAGLVLECGLQGGVPAPLTRLAACVALSTVVWAMALLFGKLVCALNGRSSFICFNHGNKPAVSNKLAGNPANESVGNGIFEENKKSVEQGGKGILK